MALIPYFSAIHGGPFSSPLPSLGKSPRQDVASGSGANDDVLGACHYSVPPFETFERAILRAAQQLIK